MSTVVHDELDAVPETVWTAARAASILEERDWLALPRWPGDGVGYLAAERTMLPFRFVTDPHGWRSMNLVDVCAGAAFALAADTELVAEARAGALPHLIVATPGYHTVPVGDRSPAALRQVVAGLEREAARRAAVLGFAHLPPAAADLLAVLQERGYRAGVASATVRLDLPGRCFEDYLARFGAKRRNWIRRERRRFATAGGRVEVVTGDGVLAELETVAELEAELQRGHGFVPDPAYFADMNRAYLRRFGKRMHLLRADLRGEPVGSLTAYAGEHDLVIRTVGLRRRDDVREAAAYFNLTYYATAELAYRLGVRRIVLGPAAWEAKLRRGGYLVPLRAALPPGAPRALAELLRRTDTELSTVVGG